MQTESTQTLFNRLKDDKRLKEIIDELIDWQTLRDNVDDYAQLNQLVKEQSKNDCNFKDASFKELGFNVIARYLAYVPESWEFIKGETPTKKKTRREALAKELRKTAQKLENDPDGKYIYTSEDVWNTPTLAEYLRKVAIGLEEIQSNPIEITLAPSRNKQHTSLEKYAPSQIKRVIHSYPLNKSGPNKEIAEIVTIVIPGLKVTPDDIQHRKI